MSCENSDACNWLLLACHRAILESIDILRIGQLFSRKIREQMFTWFMVAVANTLKTQWEIALWSRAKTDSF
jgi:hypothetical protein